MSDFARIPVTIITGFLGAGKTTVIRHALQQEKTRRLALIINEFGDVGVDGEILKACGAAACPEENIVELANGCLCCTVADDFLPTIEALLARNPAPDHILVETSGLALPKPLLKAFDWPHIRSRLTVDGVIAVVDAPAVAEGRFADDPEAVAQQRQQDASIDHDNPLEEVYEDQLLCADLVIVNKTDLIDLETAQSVAQEIARIAPRAKAIFAREGAVDPALLLGLAAAAEDDMQARPSHHETDADHDHDDFETFDVAIEELPDPIALVARIQEAAEQHDHVLRVKGFAAIKGKPMRLVVQGVGPRVRQEYDRLWRADEARRGRVVVIGKKGMDRTAIQAILCG